MIDVEEALEWADRYRNASSMNGKALKTLAAEVRSLREVCVLALNIQGANELLEAAEAKSEERGNECRRMAVELTLAKFEQQSLEAKVAAMEKVVEAAIKLKASNWRDINQLNEALAALDAGEDKL